MKHREDDGGILRPVNRGFDFLGYAFSPTSHHGPDVAERTIDNLLTRIARLYEQGADVDRIGEYIRHWLRWLNAGVKLK